MSGFHVTGLQLTASDKNVTRTFGVNVRFRTTSCYQNCVRVVDDSCQNMTSGAKTVTPIA